MSIGAILREKRESKGMTTEALGERIGVTGAMIRQIERGSRTLSLVLAAEIAKVLNCSVLDFLDDNKK